MFNILIIGICRDITDSIAKSTEESQIHSETTLRFPTQHTLPETKGFNLLIIYSSGIGAKAWSDCINYRRLKGTLPIILVSDVTTPACVELSYKVGIDEHTTIDGLTLKYLTRAISKKPYLRCPDDIILGDLSINLDKHAILKDGHKIDLTSMEQIILEHLVKHPGRIFSAGNLLDHLWKDPSSVYEETVRCHIKNLRRKLSCSEKPSIVETIRGKGYRISDNYLRPTQYAS